MASFQMYTINIIKVVAYFSGEMLVLPKNYSEPGNTNFAKRYFLLTLAVYFTHPVINKIG